MKKKILIELKILMQHKPKFVIKKDLRWIIKNITEPIRGPILVIIIGFPRYLWSDGLKEYFIDIYDYLARGYMDNCIRAIAAIIYFTNNPTH